MKFHFIVGFLIVYIIYLTANAGLYAQNSSEVQDGSKDSLNYDYSQDTLNYKVLTISTNKPTYVPGETIIVTGQLFDTVPGKSRPTDFPLNLQLIDKDPMIYGITPNTFSSVFVMTINGSFSFSGFSAPQNLTNYWITASTQYGTQANASFGVMNPLLSVQSFMLMIAFTCFGFLIFVILESGKINPITSEILRFVLISGVVISPIIGLLYSDSELGIYSPISLITKSENSNDQTNTDAIWKNQWFIAVGGMKIDSYMSGILIPFYVIIFGLAGGYLRYLYYTSNKIWHLDASSDDTSSDIDMKLPLFNWSKIPSDQEETGNFKDFLIKSLNADWIKEGNITAENEKILCTSKDKTITVSLEASIPQKIARIYVGTVFYGTIRLEEQSNGDRYAFRVTNKKMWLFYQSLTDLALLLLSPLLAIAAWFILTRGGDIDKYIVALVSFTVGLATNTIISYLTDFTTQKVKTQTMGG